jgi:hypothetical protein
VGAEEKSMNPRHLTASELLVWGIVIHLVADWVLQNDWMANNKQSLLHPAAYVHALIHGLCLAFIFGWAAVFLACAHLLIDTRKPVEWWSKLIRQTQPQGKGVRLTGSTEYVMLWDAGTEVRFWTDQVFHIACIAVAALVIT